MKVVTTEEMRRIDRETIDRFGLAAAVLMERAGLAVAMKVRDISTLREVIVLCGAGNNGGDGLVAARNLHCWGYRVTVHMLCRRSSLSPNCRGQLRLAEKFGVVCIFKVALTSADMHGAIIVDGIFGTGLARPVAGAIADLVRMLNASGATVIAIDLPSGVSADTGAVLGDAVRATHTVTFGLPKRGHLLYPGVDYVGVLAVADIGFHPSLLHDERIPVELVDINYAACRLPDRPANGYKNMFGHVLVVAGSAGKTGAALMTARACLRTGAGLVTIGVPETLLDVFMNRVTEEMALPLPDDGSGTLAPFAADEIVRLAAERFDVLAIGPGLGDSPELAEIIANVILHSMVPLVIDADGLMALSGRTDLLQYAKSPIIMTPHPGELRRLCPDGIPDNVTPIDTALAFASEHGVYLVAKGAPTITALPERRAFVNTTGNAGMATAGTGDVLTGVIAGLVAQHVQPADAAVLGVYLHGSAGDIAAELVGQHSLIATDVIDALPAAFLLLRNTGK